MSQAARRLVVLAFSEASPMLVDKYCADGVMPFLSELRARAVVGRTRYDAPFLLTPQMWATIFTGRGAGRHGVFDYWQRRPDGRFAETHGSDIKGPSVWDAFEASGVPCAVVNAPVTYPPPRASAFAISGQDAPGLHASMMHPPSLFQELERRFGRYHHKDIFPGPYAKDDYRDVLHVETRRQEEVFKHLLCRSDWRFLFLYASATAFAQHYYWSDIDNPDGRDAVKATYADVDSLIRAVCQSLDPGDAFMIISECGAGPLASGVRLNKWLEGQRWLARKSAKPSALARLLTALRTAAPRYIPRRLVHLVNGSPLKNWVQGRIASDAIDWPRTKAYHRGKGEGNIYINLAGREPQGTVAAADYEPLREEIIERLSRLIDPKTGLPAARAVHKREALFAGDIAAAPDLVVEWREFAYMPAEDLDPGGDVFGPRVREYMSWPTTGSHRREGLFLALGPGIAPRALSHPVDLRDLAPTWLETLGAAIPDVMEGKSILPQLARAERLLGADGG